MSRTRQIADIASRNADNKAGLMAFFAANTAPAGWLECNGAAVSRTAFPALFAAIGTGYGVGNGTTTFNLPDLRGEFMRGWDNGRGIDTGRAFGSAQAGDMQSHSHGLPSSIVRGTGGGSFSGNAGTNYAIEGALTSNNTGGSETRPRNIALLPCIKT